MEKIPKKKERRETEKRYIMEDLIVGQVNCGRCRSTFYCSTTAVRDEYCREEIKWRESTYFWNLIFHKVEVAITVT